LIFSYWHTRLQCCHGLSKGPIHRDTLVETACRLCSGICMGLIYCPI
jgi:hypothetical protein